MKNLILAIAVSVLSLAFATQTQAGPHTSSSKTSHVHVNVQQQTHVVNSAKTTFTKVNTSNYHLQHGTKFAQGYLYKGKNHSHWSFTRFDSRYGCNIYFDPCLHVWFYWCEPDFCYYPISYCPYRTYCRWTTVVVAQPVCTTCVQPVVPVCNTCNTVVQTGIQGQTMAPPLNVAPVANVVPPIPEPLAPTMNP